jgi:hypothetical protein
MLAAGTFEMRAVSDLEFVKSPEKGTPGVRVLCKYLEGPNKDSTIEWIGWLSEKTTAKTSESLAIMGYDGSDASTVKLCSFQGVSEAEEYDKADGTKGQRMRLQWINGASRMVSMNAAEVAGAKDRLKSALLALKSKQPAAKAEDEPRF